METVKVVPSMHTLFDDWNSMWLAGYRKPHAELVISNDLATIRAKLPGIRLEQLHISADGKSVEIRAECPHYPHRMKGGVHPPHDGVGFYAYFDLPKEIKVERAHGAYSDGMLELRLPLAHHVLA